jgi:hypothetical protein
MMIGLVGKARCGKSSVADILVNEYGYQLFPMAGAIRKAILIALPFVEAKYLHDEKESEVPDLNGVTGRKLLQSMGHDWGRGNDRDMWIKAHRYEIELMKLDFRKVVIDDVRYDNELDYIHSNGGHIIGVDRPFMDGVETDTWRTHPSEAGVDIEKIDEWISNISCLQTDLEFAVRNVMDRLLDPAVEAIG